MCTAGNVGIVYYVLGLDRDIRLNYDAAFTITNLQTARLSQEDRDKLAFAEASG